MDDSKIWNILSKYHQLKELRIDFRGISNPSEDVIQAFINQNTSLCKMTITSNINKLYLDYDKRVKNAENRIDMLINNLSNLNGWYLSKQVNSNYGFQLDLMRRNN